VVDPGVGTDRSILAIRARGYSFLVPDNGLIVPTLERPEEADEIVRVENDDYFLKPVSATFHGRDIFAALAAHLGKGVPLRTFGPQVFTFRRGGFPAASEARLPGGGRRLSGEVIHVDNFGNLITNIRVPPEVEVRGVRCGDRVVADFLTTYAEARAGELLSLVGSSGYLEIAANRDSAERRLGCSRGEKVQVELAGKPT
jgi:S-adenosylmethionine hydrolase